MYEKMPTVGGNAKVRERERDESHRPPSVIALSLLVQVFHWQTSPPVTTGLSVLAWPDKYFHNYNEVPT